MVKKERIEKELKRHNTIIDYAKNCLININKETKNGNNDKAMEYRKQYDIICDMMYDSENMIIRFSTTLPCICDNPLNRIDSIMYDYIDMDGNRYFDSIDFSEEELYR